jgi:hypothetical protein
MGSATTDALRSKRYRSRKKRGERLVSIRLTQREIETARGYVVEPGVSLRHDLTGYVIGCRRSQEPDRANDVIGLGDTSEQGSRRRLSICRISWVPSAPPST